VLGDILDKLRDRTAMLFAPGDPSRQARNWEEHAAILRAVIAGDERRAASLATEHVMRAGYDYLLGTSVIGDHVSTFEASSSSISTAEGSTKSSRRRNPKRE
jgi:hypothetical protein